MHSPRGTSWFRRAGWASQRTLLGLTAVLYLTCLGSNRALTDHEALMAGSAKQMVQQGDWLLLRIGDQLWLEKPPLPQWLAAITAIEFGTFNEWTMRLPFAITGIGVVLVVTRLMSRLLGPKLGLLAGFVQATSVYQISYARLAESDVILQFFVMSAIAVFVGTESQRENLSATDRRRRLWGFWVLVGCTNLAKGLVFGTVLTLLTCGGWFLVRGDWWGWRRWFSPVGMLVAVVIAAAWPVAVVLSDSTALQLWTDHTVGRAAGAIGYTKPFWYYATTWPTQLLPWTPFFFIGLPVSLRLLKSEPQGPDRFLWWWMLSQPLLLSLSSGKHHHYLIYALPACSAITARGLFATAAWLKDQSRSWTPALWMLRGLIASGVVVAVAVLILLPAYRIDAVVMGCGAACLLAWLMHALQQRNARQAAMALTTIFAVGHLYAQVGIIPRRDPSAADKAFIIAASQATPRDGVLVASGCQEIARHIFYADRPVVGIWEPDAIPQKLATNSELYVIARGHAREQLAQWSHVETLDQSHYTRRESTPDDRYTLFHVERAPLTAATDTESTRH
ncbi:hypothetical protein GC163_21805 [bacterium]|nr:hypothetical protein [bacterium]